MFSPQDSFWVDECTCDCHRNPHIKHCMPCCCKCPVCGKNIVAGAYDTHVVKCKKENGIELTEQDKFALNVMKIIKELQ